MKVTINYTEGVLSLPLGVLDKIEAIGENELKLLLYICSNMGKTLTDFKSESAATALGFSRVEVENALAFLRGAGFVKISGKGAPSKEDEAQQKAPATKEEPQKQHKVTVVSNAPPQYSGPELDRIVTENKALDRLRNECESSSFFARPLRPAELNMLVTMYDYFRFDEAYILQLLAMSKDKSQPMKFAYSVAVANFEKNIVTYEGLLEELARIEEKNSFEAKMKKLFGIEKRTLTTREKRFFEEWQGYDYELIHYAYELTVDSTGNASMPYMNKIITSFAEQGIRSVEEAKASNEKHRAEKKDQKPQSSFDETEFFQIALESTYKKKSAKKD